MKTVMTGAGGYLGGGMIVPFEQAGHTMRLVDIRPFESPHETKIGDVAQLDFAREVVAGMDGMVIAHMAKNPDAYVEPTVPFTVNVVGVANLLFAAKEAGLKKVVVISSTAATMGYENVDVHAHTLPPRGKGLYSMTKVVQEVIAEQFSREFGMSIAALRIGYVMDGETMVDKRGRHVSQRPALLTDRRDVGEVARLCLERDDITYEVFNVMSTEGAIDKWDTGYTRKRLNWTPKFNFDWLPLPTK